MRAVADTVGMSTSTVSQQIATLSAEAGTALIEPDGRRVRLTPAGRRLADHAVGILAALDAARADLDPQAEPLGTVRIGGFATAIRVSLLPVLTRIAASHPGVRAAISEYEPREAFRLLVDDQLDLALTYEYNLAPAVTDPVLESVALWTTPWGVAVPTGRSGRLSDLVDMPWIVNSRNTADEEAVRIMASLAGFRPLIVHQIDSLELVEDLVHAGYGVGLLPLHRPTRPSVTVLPLPEPGVVMTAFAVTRRGRSTWPPLRLLLDRLGPATDSPPELTRWPRWIGGDEA
jgi:DNA-binding transcriptional LysR family regulator